MSMTRAALAMFCGLAAVTLTACGPLSVAEAERVCLRDAELAVRPRGEAHLGVGIGGGSTSTRAGVKLEVSSDYIMGRDPSDVFNRCVMRRAGEMPSRPLVQQPGWRG
ncbi:MAG: hypothetical protein Q4G36_13415 [Paracoccus sp. (in: a-proteobacteria)]|nr:hypothetical protein [Paracoccus sp. (in: a-proteobacteria)]